MANSRGSDSRARSPRSTAATLFTAVAVIMLGILTTAEEPVRSALIYTPLAVAFTLVGLRMRRRPDRGRPPDYK
jgi:hypothetical protein